MITRSWIQAELEQQVALNARRRALRGDEGKRSEVRP
jgi:hypothetical protein